MSGQKQTFVVVRRFDGERMELKSSPRHNQSFCYYGRLSGGDVRLSVRALSIDNNVVVKNSRGRASQSQPIKKKESSLNEEFKKWAVMIGLFSLYFFHPQHRLD